jgi:hypothetical protein
MTEQEIINIIRQYEYIPKDLLKKLLCRNDCKDEDYLERKLRYLAGIRCIEYLKNEDAYCVPVFSGKVNKDRLKALWLLTQFEDVSDHYAGSNFVLIVFVSGKDLYEIVHISSNTYRIEVAAINQNIDRKNMPKRIVIVDNEDEANQIGNNILKELNCAALCTVSDNGEIISYEMEHNS